MLLALLILVVGRLPGALPALMALVLDAERIMGVGPPGTNEELRGDVPRGGPMGGLRDAPDETREDGGALARPASGWDVGPGIPMGGGGVDAADLGAPFIAPRGGGGVAFGPVCSSGLAFLLTHFLRSGS